MKGVIVGQVTQIGEVEEYGENGFKKQEVIVKTVEEYPNVYCVEFTQGNTELVKSLEVGKNAKISCRIKGREHTNDEGQYNVFHSINAWKVEEV